MPVAEVGIIDVFEGPLHDRLRSIWKRLQTPEWQIRWFSNPEPIKCHGDMLQQMWEALKPSDARYAVLTEHDFLPGHLFPGCSLFDKYPPETAVIAAEYCTRNPDTLQLVEHGIPGAWFIIVDKDRLGSRVLDFTAGGAFNDPGARLPHDITAVLKSYDCMPHHYGVRVGDVGEHLFWSRHYNDVPWQEVAGFALWDVLGRVRRTIDDYEEKTCPVTSCRPAQNSP